jgi:hypothetical protein
MRVPHRVQKLRSNVIMAALVSLCGVVTVGQAATDLCPTEQLAPLGLAPEGAADHCSNQASQTNCQVTFAGYKWWTAFNFFGPNYGNAYYTNGGLHTVFAPEHVFVDNQGLHLVVDNDANVGDPAKLPNMPWSGAEAVAMFNSAGQEVNFGYGDYLVSIQAPGTFPGALDPNVSVGMFTFERYGPFTSPSPTFGGPLNPRREIDLAEISTWGWNHQGSCPITGNSGEFKNNILCSGNAQLAIQDFTKTKIGVQRYDTGLNIPVITLVLRWRRGEVTFLKFNGAFNLNTLPSSPTKLKWTTPNELMPASNFEVATPPALSGFIPHPNLVIEDPPNALPRNQKPTKSCARFHLNFWTGNYTAFNKGQNQGSVGCGLCNPGPAAKQEVIITNFEYEPM